MPASARPQHRLGTAPLGFRGRIRLIDATGCGRSLPPAELERRLLEMGFVTNPEDERVLADPERRKAFMGGVADAIDAYFVQEAKYAMR